MRVPPHSLEAERSLLGALLLDTEAFEEVSALVTPEDFYKEPHRHIYRSMEQIAGRNEAIDVVTLVQQLRDEDRLDAVGGLSYIAGLSSVVPTAANVAFYAALVRKKSLLRRVISVSAEISEECYGDVGDVEGFINSAEARLMELSSSKANSAVRSLKDVVKEAYYQIESLYEREETITGVPSGFVDLDNKTAGWQPSDLIIVAARPAMGKCVSADAEILLDSGEVVTMEELMSRRSASLLTLRDDWRFASTSPSAWVDDGHKPLFAVTTRLGRRLKVTWTHPLLTLDGWRPLGTLSVGARIAVPRALPIFGDLQPRRAEAILLGYLLGDGSLTSATPRLTQQDPRLQRDFDEATASLPGVEQPDAVAQWLSRLGVMGCDAHQKFIPAEVFRWEREALSLFLNRLFATDGWATRLASGQVQVGYATVSERLARQLQHLLLRFGVIAKLRQRHVSYRGERREAWQLDITHGESLREFANNINIFTKEEALRPLLSDAASQFAGLDTIPPEVWAQLEEAKGDTSWAALARRAGLPDTNLHVGRRSLGRARLLKLAQALQSAALQSLAQSQVYWDEIVSIDAIGAGQVYDLTIPDTHNFVANDICVHNTAFTLNMASNAAVRFGKVVLFCSLEMSAPQLAMRLMASEARVDVSRLRVGALKESEWGRLIQATATLSKAPIFIDDSAGLTPQMLTSRARRLKVEHGLDMIIIDYLQLITSARPVASREQHISEVSRTLKMLAKEMHIPVIALAQLNRGVESRADKRPMLSDLRECVVAQTPVLLADGRRVPIVDLVGQTPTVLAYDEAQGRITPALADKVWSVGRRPVFSLRLASGRTLTATALHRLYGANGWVRVADLRPGARLAVARSLPATQEISWDTLVAVEEAGEEEVFDLTVPGVASWLADGVVSHNSGAIEQDADIISFVYRDEYYNPDSEQKGIAEVILGKHRSGSTGTVELRFFPEFTRFENLARAQDDQ